MAFYRTRLANSQEEISVAPKANETAILVERRLVGYLPNRLGPSPWATATAFKEATGGALVGKGQDGFLQKPTRPFAGNISGAYTGMRGRKLRREWDMWISTESALINRNEYFARV